MVKVAVERRPAQGAADRNSTIVQNAAAYFELVSSGRSQDHVGHRMYWGNGSVFRDCDWIRNGVRPVRGEGVTEMIETLALGLVTVALLVYLVYALLRPEKF